jgi:transposase
MTTDEKILSKIELCHRNGSNNPPCFVLLERTKYLEEKNQVLEEKLSKLEDELKETQAKLNLQLKLHFASKSEKMKKSAFNKKNDENTITTEKNKKTAKKRSKTKSIDNKNNQKKKRGAQDGHKGHGRKNNNSNLPVIEVIVELPENEKQCETCDIEYLETSLEETSSVVCCEKIYYVKKIIRKVYKKGCQCLDAKGLKTAPVLPKIISRGKFNINFWVGCLLDKYMNHLPVQRQIFEMEMNGLDNISPGTIIGGFKHLKKYIEPLYEAMLEELRKGNHWHADETFWSVFVEMDGKKGFKWYMWIFISENIVFYKVAPSRSAKVPLKVLFNIDAENLKKVSKNTSLPKQVLDYLIENKNESAIPILSADRYSAYKVLKRLLLIIIAYCWSHQRRDFVEIEVKYPNDKKLIEWSEDWIEKIAKLFHINNKRVEYAKGTNEFKKYHKKLEKNINQMQAEMKKPYKHPVKKKIMKSMKKHWDGLTIFLDHPEIPMDNNLAERCAKSPVLGKKNYWGNHSIWSAMFSAMMFSIIQTCLKHNVSPKKYLSYYFIECAKRGRPPDKDEMASFLPHRVSKEDLERSNKTNIQIFDELLNMIRIRTDNFNDSFFSDKVA